MMADLSAIGQLINDFIPIAIGLFILGIFLTLGATRGYFKNATKQIEKIAHKANFRSKKTIGLTLVLTFVFSASVGIFLVPQVSALGQITPTEGSYEMGLPIYITVEGLTADTVFTIYEIQASVETLVLNMTSSSTGKISYSVTFDNSGSARVEVREITGVTAQCSANYMILDTVNDMLIPNMIFVLTIIIVIGIFGLIGKKFPH